MHRFPATIQENLPELFTDPFRYRPHPLVVRAAEALLEKLELWASMPEGTQERALEASLAEGKMLGVLVVSEPSGEVGYLCGFSGNVAGTGTIEGFVPPIFDLTDPDGYFRKEEAVLNELSARIRKAEDSEELSSLKEKLKLAELQRDEEITEFKAAMSLRKAERAGIRAVTEDAATLASLTRESQHEKAELRRLKAAWEGRISSLKDIISKHSEKIDILKKERAVRSDILQKWIFENFVVTGYDGSRTSILDIFASKGLTPPGGTGECAAPKMLNHAFSLGLKPLAMGEFWYGRASSTAVRSHGHFYPSCTSKCGPLLSHMLTGMKLGCDDAVSPLTPVILYEDTWIVIAEKPSGLPSVPGLDGRISLQELLGKGIRSVHRLDMDTSGVMVYAKDEGTAAALQKQFEEHSVRKTYKARLSRPDRGRFAPSSPLLEEGSSGSISLPLAPDYDERPRQKADISQGKPSLTEYEVVSLNDDGTVEMLFRPHTGRTHQLRVHSAHSMGLARPIAGDLLYGGMTCPRLCLHALSLTFIHPETGKEMTFTSDSLSY